MENKTTYKGVSPIPLIFLLVYFGGYLYATIRHFIEYEEFPFFNQLVYTIFLVGVLLAVVFKHYYFELTSDSFMVKNYFRPNWSCEFPLEDIDVIEAKFVNKQGKTVKIFLKREGKRDFYTTAVSVNRLCQMLEDLEERGVKTGTNLKWK